MDTVTELEESIKKGDQLQIRVEVTPFIEDTEQAVASGGDNAPD